MVEIISLKFDYSKLFRINLREWLHRNLINYIWFKKSTLRILSISAPSEVHMKTNKHAPLFVCSYNKHLTTFKTFLILREISWFIMSVNFNTLKRDEDQH